MPETVLLTEILPVKGLQLAAVPWQQQQWQGNAAAAAAAASE